jgi:hypothetical protein
LTEETITRNRNSTIKAKIETIKGIKTSKLWKKEQGNSALRKKRLILGFFSESMELLMQFGGKK